jgi:hypothetical protein
MVPIYLTIVFCLIGQAQTCREIRPDMADDFPMAGLAACQMTGERIASEYEAIHPKWHLSRVKCRIGVPPREQGA